MGTHPIFESDFDCLTEMGNLLGKNNKKREESPVESTPPATPVEQAPVPTGLPVVQEEAEQKLESAIEQATGAVEEAAQETQAAVEETTTAVEEKTEAVTEEVAAEVEQVTKAV